MKRFIVIGNKNAVTYKEIFPLIKENKVWIGYTGMSSMDFIVPEGYGLSKSETLKRDGDGHILINVAACWFTNLDTYKRHWDLDFCSCKMKRFIVIGNGNAVTYKEVFPLIKENKVWLGLTMDGRNKWFEVPMDYPVKENVANWKIEDGKKYLFVAGCVWFTNLETYKRPFLVLKEHYSPERYPRYDNYDAINVDRTDEIPIDYPGVMGVPISFLDKYNPEQFEILDARDYAYFDRLRKKSTYLIKDGDSGSVNGDRKYARILIRFKEGKCKV